MPTLRSHNGLAAVDLVRKGPAGDIFRTVLQEFHDKEELAEALNADTRSVKSLEKQPCRRASIVSLPTSPSLRSVKLSKIPSSKSQAELAYEKDQQTRLDAAIETAQTLQLDFAALDIEQGTPATSSHAGLSSMPEVEESEDMEALPPFDWEACQPEQMLAFSYQDLPAILDLATEIRPSRKADARFMPANVIFLAARYASRYAGEDLLGELMIGAIDRIEASIHVSAFLGC